MADFRRSLTALAVLALLLGVASTASAQGQAFTCTAANGAVPPLLRSEGMTELTGDILLNCTGGVPVTTGNIPQANVTVFLNTTVTSRLMNSSNLSEAMLLVDEPTAAAIKICDPSTTGGTACLNVAGTGTPFNAIQGIWGGSSSSNSVTFLGVPVNPPGTSGTRVFRITNVRANANGIGVGAGFITNQVQATVGISGSTSIPVNNNLLNVGVVQKGLNTAVRRVTDVTSSVGSSQISLNQCSDRSRKAGESVLEFTEGFATAFKTRTVAPGNPPAYTTLGTTLYDQPSTPTLQNTPGAIYNSESGFMPTTTGPTPGAIGVANFGTRLKAVFNNIPTGASVYVTAYNLNNAQNTFARLTGTEVGDFFPAPITNSDVTAIPTSAGFTQAVAITQVAQLPVVNNSATAIWEVLASDPLAQQSYFFGVYFGWTGAAGTNSPAPGTGTVNLSFAPTPPSFAASDGSKASSSLAIPRFADTSTATNIVSVVICRTILLYPFTPNIAGFDTGIEISNTSMDPFGTTPQAGTCSLNWYGSTSNGTGPAPPASPVPSIAGGATYAALVSNLAAGFNGYMIAICNFQFAHGFAYVYNNGLQQAQGYLALVIPDPGTGSRTAQPPPAGSSGENLAN